jgi:alcohol dehydrogenase
VKALVFHGPGHIAWEEKPRPRLTDATDAIVKVVRTSVCGTDLSILTGKLPRVTEDRILGHEGVGVVEEVGTAVATLNRGDRVVISCITSCALCLPCRRGMPSHCVSGGWILGHAIDGTQAEYVRIPHADASLFRVPRGVDETSLVMLSDILPTGLEVGVLKGAVKPGDTVVIAGGGPVGLAVLLTAQLYSPSEVIVVDVDEHRLALARQLGATATIDASDGKAAETIRERTRGQGVDVAVEAAGQSATFELCQDVVAVGGHLANVGVHAASVPLKLNELWSRNVTLTTGLVDGTSTPLLLKFVAAGRLLPRPLVTHEFALDEVLKAYDTFAHAPREKALKVVLRARG